MRKDCSTCKHDYIETEYPLIEPCNACIASSGGGAPSRWEASEHYRPPTNADRIRAMTDEELANCIETIVTPVCSLELDCNSCLLVDICLHRSKGISVLDWIRQPVKED